MIKYFDFKLGNIINPKFPMKITGLFDDVIYANFAGNEGDTFEYKFEEIIPIELDDEYLDRFGFKNGWLDTEGYKISCHFYDIWHLEIEGKPKYSDDKIYVSNYFKVHEFQNIINSIIGQDLEFK